MRLILVSGDEMSKDGAHYFNVALTKPVHKNDLQRAMRD